jgi:hypothetical protein
MVNLGYMSGIRFEWYAMYSQSCTSLVVTCASAGSTTEAVCGFLQHLCAGSGILFLISKNVICSHPAFRRYVTRVTGGAYLNKQRIDLLLFRGVECRVCFITTANKIIEWLLVLSWSSVFIPITYVYFRPYLVSHCHCVISVECSTTLCFLCLSF